MLRPRAFTAASGKTWFRESSGFVDHEVFQKQTAPVRKYLAVNIRIAVAGILPDHDAITVFIHTDGRLDLRGGVGIVVEFTVPQPQPGEIKMQAGLKNRIPWPAADQTIFSVAYWFSF